MMPSSLSTSVPAIAFGSKWLFVLIELKQVHKQCVCVSVCVGAVGDCQDLLCRQNS